MMEQNIEHALELTLELEGLLMLKKRRADKTPTEVDRLISEKVTQLSALLGVDGEMQQVAVSAQFEESEDGVELEEPPTPVEEMEPTASEGNAHEEEEDEEEEDEEPTEFVSLASLFTLNDKFRFSRELFGNDRTEMDETLALLGRMSSMEEVEDYIYNDLCWDAQNPSVVDFLSVLSNKLK